MKSELFNISAGVDTLAPFLFAIVLDYAIMRAMDGKEKELSFKITKRRSRRHLKKVIADLDFTDDIALLSDTFEEAQKLLLCVESEGCA